MSQRRGAEIRSSTSAATESPKAASIATRPQLTAVERIDDTALLAILADTPSALVEWSDGRRSLLVVVRSAERK